MASERYRAVTVTGGAISVLGALLPWLAEEGIHLTKLNVSSVFVLLAGAGVVALAITKWKRTIQYVIGVLGAIVIGLALEAITDFAGDGPPGGMPPTTTPTPDPGIGAYLALLGGVLVVIGVALERFD